MPQLVHTLDSHLDLVHDGVTLFSYVYRPQTPAIESPRPYFHPLRTLKGNVVSGFRPHDHRWHHGLSMTCANLSGVNFWGGPTYLRDGGYVQLNNNGEQRQVGWGEIPPHIGDSRSHKTKYDESFEVYFDQVHRWQLDKENILMNESRKLIGVTQLGNFEREREPLLRFPAPRSSVEIVNCVTPNYEFLLELTIMKST